MMPIAPLMMEHRLIEKMVKTLDAELQRLKAGGEIDRKFNRAAVDFFRVYADQTHHGKEEQIFFRELEKKSLSSKHQSIMEELISEHVEARKAVGSLLAAQTSKETIECLEKLVALYPPHIAKEDKEFFIPIMDYFSDQERAAMLQEGQEFDRTMIHKKYGAVVEELEQNLSLQK